MATGKRKSSSGRKTSGRKTNSGRKKNDIQQESFTEEVILWVILAISILLFISNFGIGGAIGNAVSSFLFWCIWFDRIYFSGCFGDRYFFCGVQ